ncbi:MAG: sugar kinase, partial [Alphaproteobacteria bacterium HGW-Alphaproteobacteria-10]
MAGKARIDAVRARNRALLLAALRYGGARSRTELAADTGLSGATISAIGAQMLAEGLIAPAGPTESFGESPARG